MVLVENYPLSLHFVILTGIKINGNILIYFALISPGNYKILFERR